MTAIKKRGKDAKVSANAETTTEQGSKMAQHLLDHFNILHGMRHRRNDREIETLLLRQKEHEVEMIGSFPTYPKDLVKFNPSGSSKSNLELYFRAKGEEARATDLYPYHDRWTRNATAVHEFVQRDLLYIEKFVPSSMFSVERTAKGLPAWEQNILTYKVLEHKGKQFVLNGMMDGILNYKGQKIGFEFKTKSSTIGQVGHYKMKDAQADHKLQCVAYSLLFGLDDYILMYESVAKDGWMKGAEAKPDIRAFHVHVTEEMRQDLLDKFASVVESVETDTPPEHEPEKCFFSPYKHLCGCEVAE